MNMQTATIDTSTNGGGIYPPDLPPTTYGSNGARDLSNDGMGVYLALELAAVRLGISFDSLMYVTNVVKALHMAEHGQFKAAILVIDNLRLKDCRSMVEEEE